MVVLVELQSLIHGANGSEVPNNPSENAETHTHIYHTYVCMYVQM